MILFEERKRQNIKKKNGRRLKQIEKKQVNNPPYYLKTEAEKLCEGVRLIYYQ